MSENKKAVITVETTVKVPVAKVWKYWTNPESIIKWNAASEDWYTPFAENDLRVGGKFLSRMEARDGSFGFDFSGSYDHVKGNESIAYTLDDDRKVNIDFVSNGDETRIIERFEAETENSLELQQQGWQEILNSFKKYAEYVAGIENQEKKVEPYRNI